MDFTVQESRAGKADETAQAKGKTCIDGHQGIAPTLPEGPQDRCREVAKEVTAGTIPKAPGTKFAVIQGADIALYRIPLSTR